MATTLFLILSRTHINGAAAGFMLVFAGSISNNVNWLMVNLRQFELKGISLERTTEYRRLPREDGATINDSLSHSDSDAEGDELADWPSRGELHVKDLRVRYGPGMPDILQDVTFDVEGGQRIGIVGATGSGKSTLAKAFFSFVDVTNGSIEIDDKGEYLST